MGDIGQLFASFAKSRGCVASLTISILLSFGLATTVGIVPAVISDRYARLHYGWDGKPCYTFDHDLMPNECMQGGDDAQSGSAWMSLVQNVLLFVSNPVIGSQSDVYGRRSFLILGMLLSSLSPAVLVLMQHVPRLDPFFYFAANSSVGLVSYITMLFAAIADSSTKQFLAASYAIILSGFYSGFCVAPSLVLFMSHEAAAWLSFLLCVAALVFAVAFFPETLPQEIAQVAAVHHAERLRVPTNPDQHDPSTAISLVESVSIITTTTDPSNASTTMSTPSTSLLSFPQNDLTVEERDIEHRQSNWKICGAIVLHPFREMSILYRSTFLQMVTLASFLSAVVYSTDVSLVLFYIEEHLNVRDSDIAQMFFFMGILGVLLQAIGLQPLVTCLGEKGLLIVSFLSGTLHNFLYGVARNKTAITIALSVSQLTKLNYAILSSLASKAVFADEQGQVQGALLATNALAGALGPISMNYIYEKTKDSRIGPGTMFLFASFLYFIGTISVTLIPTPEDPSYREEEEQSATTSECESLQEEAHP